MFTGANRFLVTVAGGQLLLDTADYKQLQCVARPAYEKVNQTDIDGLYDIYWSDGQEFNIYHTDGWRTSGPYPDERRQQRREL